MSTVLAALVLAAMPVMALASDDCDDSDCDDPPAAVVTPVPTPAPTPAPTQSLPMAPGAPAPSPLQRVAGKRVSSVRRTHRRQHTRVHRTLTRVSVVRTAAVQQTIPSGGVQAGAGGTAPAGPGELSLGLAGGSLLLLATGGGLLARARRESS